VKLFLRYFYKAVSFFDVRCPGMKEGVAKLNQSFATPSAKFADSELNLSATG